MAFGHTPPTRTADPALDPTMRLPLSVLIHYLFFLSRRPISRSNRHYLAQRLRGLKALSRELRGTNHADLEQAIHLLDKMTPVNFALLNEKLQYALLPLSPSVDELPPDLVVSSHAPSMNVFARARKIALLCGPAIGIGDEIILFPLPGWIKQANPDASITVLSAYGGLWDAVRNVDAVQRYSSYTDLLHVLRGETPFDEFDLVILADFDRPGLYPAVACEGSPPCYVELSLGTEAVFVVDNAQRSLYRMPRLAPYSTNFYAGFAEMARWLGLSPSDVGRFDAADSAVVQRPLSPPATPLQIYVSPFTSKYDPSPIYWGRLLCALLADAPADLPVRCVLDAGPNAATLRFAQEIIQSVAARVPAHVELAVAEPADPEMPGLAAALSWMAAAHVVICADSFTAHAAPLFGGLTCVMAASGLANWRVPHQASFYFSAEDAIAANAAAIRSLIQVHQQLPIDTAERPAISDAEHDLLTATDQLAACFAAWHAHQEGRNPPETPTTTVDAASVLRHYQAFVDAYGAVVSQLPSWPSSVRALARDLDYSTLIQPPPAAAANHHVDDLLRHLHDRWWQWEHANVRKCLRLLQKQGQAEAASADPYLSTPTA